MNRSLSSFVCQCWLLIAVACGPAEIPPDEHAALPSADSSVSAHPVEDDLPVVVFLGTSLTAGLGLARAEDTYVAQLEEIADSAGLPIHAVNAGVSGETSAGGLRRLDWTLREPLDVLFIELGANDGLRGQDPASTEQNLLDIVTRTHERYPEASVMIAGMEAPPNLGVGYTTRFREIFPSVSRRTGATLVPFLLEGVAGVPELNQSDGIHPTPEGHRMMARSRARDPCGHGAPRGPRR